MCPAFGGVCGFFWKRREEEEWCRWGPRRHLMSWVALRRAFPAGNAPVPSPGGTSGCCAQLWLLSTAGPGAPGAEQGPGAAPCPGKAEGAGAAQLERSPRERGLSPGYPCVPLSVPVSVPVCRAQSSPGSAPGPAMAPEPRAGAEPSNSPAQEEQLLPWAALSRDQRGSGGSSLGIFRTVWTQPGSREVHQ